MNRQELFDGNIVNRDVELETSYLPFIQSVRRVFSDVTYPFFFSGWPYFVLILAALLMGSSKVSSQVLENKDLDHRLERSLTSTESFLHHTPQPSR